MPGLILRQTGAMAISKRKWSDLSPRGKAGVVALATVHVTLVGWAHADLSRRPAAQVHGPKWVWRILTGTNTAFTVAYLAWGRHRTPELRAVPSDG